MSEAPVTAAAARRRVTAYAGILGSVLSAGLLLAASGPPATLVGALLLACVPAGAGVMCWIDAGESAAQAGLVLAVSLAVFGLLSAGLIWAALWHPPVLISLAALSLASCCTQLILRGER